MTAAAREHKVALLPVDSEHSAIFQCLQGHRRSDVHRILLTASGGPFRTLPKAELDRVSVAEALRHPTWKMGAKITVDSATLMNKGLEVIEASFDVEHHLEVALGAEFIVELGLETGRGHDALSIARGLATISYRSPEEFAERFSDASVDRYLRHQGDKFARAFAPARFLAYPRAGRPLLVQLDLRFRL